MNIEIYFCNLTNRDLNFRLLCEKTNLSIEKEIFIDRKYPNDSNLLNRLITKVIFYISNRYDMITNTSDKEMIPYLTRSKLFFYYYTKK